MYIVIYHIVIYITRYSSVNSKIGILIYRKAATIYSDAYSKFYVLSFDFTNGTSHVNRCQAAQHIAIHDCQLLLQTAPRKETTQINVWAASDGLPIVREELIPSEKLLKIPTHWEFQDWVSLRWQPWPLKMEISSRRRQSAKIFKNRRNLSVNFKFNTNLRHRVEVSITGGIMRI